MEIVFNGGLSNEEEIPPILSWADGVMIGRAAYQNPELLFYHFLSSKSHQQYREELASLNDI